MKEKNGNLKYFFEFELVQNCFRCMEFRIIIIWVGWAREDKGFWR